MVEDLLRDRLHGSGRWRERSPGRLIRIYPITLRFAGNAGGTVGDPFRKYDWIDAEVERASGKDQRPESYRINQDSIRTCGHIDHSPDGWEERRRWVLGEHNVYSSVEELRERERADRTSLGLIRPKTIHRFYERRKDAEAKAEWEAERDRALAQKDLFVDAESVVKELRFMPITYRVEFDCEGPGCTGHDMSILDWELYALSRRMFAQRGAMGASKAVIDKLTQMVDAEKRDAYFYLGNVAAHPTSFMVVGLFTPPRRNQMRLF